MKVCIQTFDDTVNVQFIAKEPSVSLDSSKEFHSNRAINFLRDMGEGEHTVDNQFFKKLQRLEKQI